MLSVAFHSLWITHLTESDHVYQWPIHLLFWLGTDINPASTEECLPTLHTRVYRKDTLCCAKHTEGS